MSLPSQESDAAGGPTLLPEGQRQAWQAGVAYAARYLNASTCSSDDTCLDITVANNMPGAVACTPDAHGFCESAYRGACVSAHRAGCLGPCRCCAPLLSMVRARASTHGALPAPRHAGPEYGVVGTPNGTWNNFNSLFRSSALDRTIMTARSFLDAVGPLCRCAAPRQAAGHGAGMRRQRRARRRRPPLPTSSHLLQVFPPINMPTDTQYLPDGQQVRRSRHRMQPLSHAPRPAPGCSELLSDWAGPARQAGRVPSQGRRLRTCCSSAHARAAHAASDLAVPAPGFTAAATAAGRPSLLPA